MRICITFGFFNSPYLLESCKSCNMCRPLHSCGPTLAILISKRVCTMQVQYFRFKKKKKKNTSCGFLFEPTCALLSDDFMERIWYLRQGLNRCCRKKSRLNSLAPPATRISIFFFFACQPSMGALLYYDVPPTLQPKWTQP